MVIDTVKMDRRDVGISVVTLNEPPKQNALDVPMTREMTRLFRECD